MTNSFDLRGFFSLTPYSPPPQPVKQWVFVEERFEKFLNNILLTDAQLEDGLKKIKGITKCLNKHYWGVDSDNANMMLVGSWGKHTRVSPPRDIDLVFFLPPHLYERFSQRVGNIQSQILQDVKEVLLKTFSTTAMRGDGQVVVIPFASYKVEVAPAFGLNNGHVLICDTNNDGKFKDTDPFTEIQSFSNSDKQLNRNARDLVRMLKTWQRYHQVPLKSFILERLAVEFLERWPYRGYTPFWYDWMVKDFFYSLLSRRNGFILLPGTFELIPIGDEWLSKAQRAYQYAFRACNYERLNADVSAANEWQVIFGYSIPRLT